MGVRSAVTKRPKKQRAITLTTPAPIKGLNTVDLIGGTDMHYALSMQNCIATPQGVSLRQGFRKMVTGLPAAATTLMPWNSGSASTSKLFAIAGASIYDVTSAGAVGAAVVTGLSGLNNYWQYASQTYTTSGKNYLFCVNGFDSPRMYEGTAWTTCTQVASPSAPGQFKNVDNNGNAVNIADFSDVLLHQQRLFFVRKNSTTAYYCDVTQVGGNLYPLDFGPFFSRGGHLFKLATWSVNLGDVSGVQSVLVAISDKGDVVIFKGNNPASSSTWALAGTYSLGAPVGQRCTMQFESDLLYLSRDGLYPLSQYIQTNSLSTEQALTYTIANTISDLADTFANTPGFEMVAYPGNNLFLLNVPQYASTQNFQFCYNTIQKGWSQFTGWPATSWCLFNNTLYFGGPDYIGMAFIGYSDGADSAGSGGNNVVATVLTSYTNFDEPGVLKHPHLVKPYFITGAVKPTVSIGVNTDYNLIPITGSATLNTLTGGIWDSSLWDNPNATWVGSLTVFNEWSTPNCYQGEVLALAMSFSATADTMWTSTGWVLEPGGFFS